jgi:hypothetical protein
MSDELQLVVPNGGSTLGSSITVACVFSSTRQAEARRTLVRAHFRVSLWLSLRSSRLLRFIAESQRILTKENHHQVHRPRQL